MHLSNFVKQTAERASRAAVFAYVAVWQSNGLDYDHLFTITNLKGAVVGAALSLSVSLGAKNVGSPDSPSLLK